MVRVPLCHGTCNGPTGKRRNALYCAECGVARQRKSRMHYQRRKREQRDGVISRTGKRRKRGRPLVRVRVIPPLAAALIVDTVASGWSTRDTAADFGVTPHTIRRVLRRTR